jgi:hypothetical protein
MRTTLAVSASTVSSRATASPHAVPKTFATSATGLISSIEPGGCTMAKSRYAIAPWTSRTALPKYTPSSYWVYPER